MAISSALQKFEEIFIDGTMVFCFEGQWKSTLSRTERHNLPPSVTSDGFS